LPNVSTDDWLLIVPTDDYGMGDLRRSPRYRNALWFDRLGWVCAPVWLILLFTHHAIALSIPVLALILVLARCSIVLRRRAGVPSMRPSKSDAPARYRWRQYRRDVFWLRRR
jgi:hypothetical protein